MRLAITGAHGFLGRNFCERVAERHDIEVLPIGRHDAPELVASRLRAADFIFHFAGVNRPLDDHDYHVGNAELTKDLCARLAAGESPKPILLTSSAQAALDNPYGRSKRQAERYVAEYADSVNATAFICRLPNVFGQWARPNYNSVVATFCFNLSRDLPIAVNDPDRLLELAHVDDVADAFLSVLTTDQPPGTYALSVAPVYRVTVGDLAELIVGLRDGATDAMEVAGLELGSKMAGVYSWYAHNGHLVA